MEQQDFVEVDGLRARVHLEGDGPHVVVLHGWGGRIESMAPVLACLRGAFRTVALDLPGFGDSPPPPAVWGTPEYARFVAGVMDRLGVVSADFVGHSFGAKASLWLGATQPERVRRLVLVGSPGIKSARSTKVRAKRVVSRAARAAGRLGAPGQKLREAVYRRIASSDYRDAGPLRSILVKVVNEDLSSLMPNVSAPTLLVWGEQDDAVPVEHARRMEKLIPDAGLVVFEGAGHFAYLDQPATFCRVLTHFFHPQRA